AKSAIYCDPTWESSSSQLTIFDHNDVLDPHSTRYAGTCSDQTGTYGNISVDPRFVNPSAGDYHLQAGSPAIDAGNNSALQLVANAGVVVSKDLDGNPREQDATGIGNPIVDIGV